MEEITFLDIINHYRIKIKEISDDADQRKTDIKNIQANINTAWKCNSAEALNLKLEEIYSDIQSVQQELSEISAQLSLIEEDAENGQIILV